MVVDANMYWIPGDLFTDSDFTKKFLDAIPGQCGLYGYESRVPETGKRQIVIEKPKGYQNLNYIEGQYEIETQLEDMNIAGIDRAILKTPGCQEWMNLELCKLFNDGMGVHVKRGRGRFYALAVVPPQGTKECIHELERCIHDLGMTGVQLSAHYGDLYLDAEEFKPFLRKLNELKIPAYIHHTAMPAQYDSLVDYNNLRRSYGRCADQVTALGRELFSGMFAEFPNLKFIHSMLGGAFFAYMDLLFPQEAAKKEEPRFKTEMQRTKEYLKHNIYFEMSHAAPWGKSQLECAVKTMGADHILFGTSYPVRPEWLTGGPDFVKDLDIGDDEKDLILGLNALRIYNIT
jgi:predicted TIM-barrel fold metal-dependent hydrolase